MMMTEKWKRGRKGGEKRGREEESGKRRRRW